MRRPGRSGTIGLTASMQLQPFVQVKATSSWQSRVLELAGFGGIAVAAADTGQEDGDAEQEVGETSLSSTCLSKREEARGGPAGGEGEVKIFPCSPKAEAVGGQQVMSFLRRATLSQDPLVQSSPPCLHLHESTGRRQRLHRRA